ncbi:efflux RND transporter permease subunit [Chitinophaga sancti]|uniref:Efflux RND transporter permease subunit n=1 Tax=Chitinophaga sancti TaxID=1004 RepID=A0A1K1M6T2_9BACT|nr:efflux RND transporter permease subunit [Chitinophaga sancti]WQD64595.1 efflux RND transporter permease subunit [Chitinophaga sancti]WQG89781.1 efflux RND transporter permease subunit [Chitinophaga sancti]SFW18783.1 Multidrug efflux pump subunit AcrB [Chitinophaga sancti]
MKLITAALRHPVTILVTIMAILFFSYLSVRNTKIDIFPRLGLPVVYVAQPYGGLSPEQMEGFITSYYEYHFLYITGVKYVESKSIQGAALIKLEFNEGTDMSQAMAEVVGYVNRSRAFMPPGTVPPFVTRFDAGSVPVGQLVFSSDSRSLSEISDLALFKVRPMFSTLPGVSAPPPFGGNQKTVLVTIDPEKLRSYNLSPDQVVQTLVKFNTISPSGNVRIGDTTYITPQNSVIETLQDLQNAPLRLEAGPTVYVKDIANVSMGADVTTSYALINGKRSVYIPVTKRSDASTWDVVQKVKAALPDMQAAIPSDIKVTYEFDQSGYVINSLKSLLFEGGLGAIFTGLMVLLFLGDRRSALIVILTIPLALLTSATLLYLAGQTINIMTLGGLALSVGILVDEATVTIENIHRHMEAGKGKARAIADATKEIAGPKLLILLSILAVFVPSMFMSGVPKAMFMPLSLAVGFAMIASFLLSQTFVPVIANWWLKSKPATEASKQENDYFSRIRQRYINAGQLWKNSYRRLSWLFLFISIVLVAVIFVFTGTELFPQTDSGLAQVRLRLPVGSRFERTEEATHKLLSMADSIAGKGNTEISSAFIGTQPSSYPVNYIYLWTGGPQESVTRIKLKSGVIPIETFREKLRKSVQQNMPDVRISFEPGDMVEQVLNQGSTNPIEISVVNRNLADGRKTAEQVVQKLSAIPALRDVQISTPLDYPAIRLNIDRVKAGQLGISSDQIARSVVTATSSSRFTAPSYWLDKTTGTAYQVQVQYPEYLMNSTAKLEAIPISGGTGSSHYLNEVANWKYTTVPGEYDRLNQQRYITITANIHQQDAGSVFKKVNQVIADMGKLSNGSKIKLRGQPELLQQTLTSLQFGLLVAVIVIFLVIAVYFQSFRIALVTLAIIPAVIAGALLFLLITGNSLNIQSYMGTIMAVGVAIANAVLFITNAEHYRQIGDSASYMKAAANRLRPILMTSAAMIAGMIPMALGLSEGGDQTSPLGIAVIGGLLFSAFSVLFFLPHLYQLIIGRKVYKNISLDPDDINSASYDK